MSWVERLQAQAAQRNARQRQLDDCVLEDYRSLFRQFFAQDLRHTSLKHKLVLVERELFDLEAKEGPAQAIRHATKSILSMKTDLMDSMELESLLNLNNVVHELRRANGNLSEELSLAKKEYQRVLEQMALLQAELDRSKPVSSPTSMKA